MVLTQYGYVAGITSLLLVILSYIFGGMILGRHYAASRRIETFVQGLSFFIIGSNWLSSSLAFLIILLNGTLPSQKTLIYVWSWAPAATATIYFFLVISLIRPNLKLTGLGLYLFLDLVYGFLMYMQTDQYATFQLIGGLPNLGVQGIAIAFLLFYILSALVFIGPAFLWIGFKSKRLQIRLKGKIIGLGIMIFAFFAIFETIIGPSALLLIISRILLLCAVFLIYLGLILPFWIKTRFLTEPQTSH